MRTYRITIGPRGGTGNFRLVVLADVADECAGEFGDSEPARREIQAVAHWWMQEEMGYEWEGLRVLKVETQEPDGVWRKVRWVIPTPGREPVTWPL